MMIERILKVIMSGGLAILTALIAYANIHDPGANLKFLEHVLTMDTVALDSAMRDHALPIPVAWWVAFWLIVVGEVLTAALFAVGAVELWRARNSKARQFHEAKRFVDLGAVGGLLIWFVGFTAIGGEWYAMWQSQVWNGQQAAFRSDAWRPTGWQECATSGLSRASGLYRPVLPLMRPSPENRGALRS